MVERHHKVGHAASVEMLRACKLVYEERLPSNVTQATFQKMLATHSEAQSV